MAPEDRETPSPDEAFATLGSETRLSILQALGAADRPLAFSTLFDRVDVDDSGRFNYHLGRLVSHFVGKTDAGYELTQAGRRVVEAVLSGAVTDAPVVERTRLDQPCHYCGAPIEVSYRQDRVLKYCTDCPGRNRTPRGVPDAPAEGYLGSLPLPPQASRDGRRARRTRPRGPGPTSNFSRRRPESARAVRPRSPSR
ncbi:hypothetical protein C2R22_14175 [Salinigranum rubrum]|uniref:DUF7347 domain-containing protein n=1 Tax=Salinigranum rubrum TaxID=755307 RepID=A0A2I8VL74_9EURY|nr:helix-turn-helix domain-containing protein [Salinigranum rubrum]AUV82645.1 hypothetical protein C2R22_14175 [Salinigranum rubrum]